MCLIIIAIVTISILICIILVSRFINYNILTNLTAVPNINQFTNIYDNLYNDHIKSYKSIDYVKYIEQDYENKDISMVADSYNIGYMREFPWSHPTDVTIKLANLNTSAISVLDLGAGTGMVAIYICTRLPNIIIDCVVNSKNLFNIIESNIKTHNMGLRIKVCKQDFNTHDFDKLDKKYDRILSLESIGYAHNRHDLINKCYNMLNPGGLIFIKTPSFASNMPANIAQEFINIWDYNFSTLGSLLNDAKSTGSTDIKYKSFKLYHNFLNINPSDIVNGIKYCVKNKINLIRHAYIYSFHINYDLVSINKT
jgi:2-polyprenyl-3-methyl-5-hydroxy-6-metoxy-1,4-benzoquinol methylase